MTPSARSIALLRAEGFVVDTVERWIPGARIRRDLFGMFDLIGIRASSTLAVQVTTADHLAHRRRKVLESPLLAAVQAAGWQVELHGWPQGRPALAMPQGGVMRRSIEGLLTPDALAALYGTPHRQQPVDRDTARAAAFELASRGLTPLDIAVALGLSEAAVRALLKVPS